MKIYKRINLLINFLIILSFFPSCQNTIEPEIEKEKYLPELIFINKGLTFTMGRLDLPNWTYTNLTEVPSFKAILEPYYIGKYEVRNDEYNYFVSDNGYSDSTLWSREGWKFIKSEKRDKPKGWTKDKEPWKNRPYSNTGNRPISDISWYEAEAYCNWLSRKTGENYSLPTEAQWERAARGPDPGFPFPWGNKDDQSKLNNMMFSRKLYPVGSFEKGKSAEGCYDMAGNLEEYCLDWFELYIYKKYKKNEPVYNPSGTANGQNSVKAIRGTFTVFHHIREIERQITTFRRLGCLQKDSYPTQGFRIVKNLK